MQYLHNNQIQPQQGSLSPMMAGEHLHSGMFLHVLFENEFPDGPQSYNGTGILISWEVNELDIWMDVLCGDQIITMPLHYGNEVGTPTTLMPIQ